jgi:hypothetical protein
MNDYVIKPIDAGTLLNTVNNLTANIKITLPKKSIVNSVLLYTTPDKVCNMDYLMGATRVNKKIIHNIVAVFFKETKKELTFLNDAIKKINYPVIGDISHKIKSAFSILGISALEPVFKEIEQLSSNTSSIANIEVLNQRVHLVFNQAREEMKLEN